MGSVQRKRSMIERAVTQRQELARRVKGVERGLHFTSLLRETEMLLGLADETTDAAAAGCFKLRVCRREGRGRGRGALGDRQERAQRADLFLL